MGMASQITEREDMIITPDLRGNVPTCRISDNCVSFQIKTFPFSEMFSEMSRNITLCIPYYNSFQSSDHDILLYHVLGVICRLCSVN